VKGQLQAYKVVTALLCCVLLVLLLIRFTRPTVKALQKRCECTHSNTHTGAHKHQTNAHTPNTWCMYAYDLKMNIFILKVIKSKIMSKKNEESH